MDFGGIKYSGTFHVVPGSIPLILGMQFLGEMSPVVDWASKTVVISGQRLHTVPLGGPRVS